MKQKSDRKKLEEGRCQGLGEAYVPLIKAREANSYGYASQLYDPVTGRTCDTLSTGEQLSFWLFRFNPRIKDIREQFVLPGHIVDRICEKNGFDKPRNLLSLDFILTYVDGKQEGISVKKSPDEFDESKAPNRTERKRVKQNIIIQSIYRLYCEEVGYDFSLIYRTDIERDKGKAARNIRAVLKYYDPESVTTVDQMYKYLIAHRYITVDLESGYIHFAAFAREHETEIKKLYKKVTENDS